jgi:uncharacterized protein
MRTSSLHRLAYAPVLACLLVGCALDDGQSDIVATIESSPRPYFELFEDSAGNYAFRFAGEGHDTLMDSKWYESRHGALGGIVSVLDNGGLAQHYRIVEVQTGGYGIELVARNGVVVAESFLYASPEAAQRGIDEIVGAIAEFLEFQHQRSGARFDIYQDQAGRYFFDLYAGDGNLVLVSQPYSSEAAALNGAFSTQENGVRPERYRLIETEEGSYFLELRASNGRTLATSPIFEDRSDAEASRSAIRELLPYLPIL